jgi:hypothetical protein
MSTWQLLATHAESELARGVGKQLLATHAEGYAKQLLATHARLDTREVC